MWKMGSIGLARGAPPWEAAALRIYDNRKSEGERTSMRYVLGKGFCHARNDQNKISDLVGKTEKKNGKQMLLRTIASINVNENGK